MNNQHQVTLIQCNGPYVQTNNDREVFLDQVDPHNMDTAIQATNNTCTLC